MIVFHTTLSVVAEVILADGFDDRSFLDGGRTGARRGCWIADAPVPLEFDIGESRIPSTVLRAEIPTSVVAPFVVEKRYAGEEEAPWREYLVPADVLNAYAWDVEGPEGRRRRTWLRSALGRHILGRP